MKDFKRAIILIAPILLLYTPSFSQDSSEYIKALYYIIKQNPDKNIVVSDTIIHFPFTIFSKHISEIWGKNRDVVSDTLYKVDQEQEKLEFELNEFKNLQFPGSGPTQVIYFSNFYSSMVIGEILEKRISKHGLNHDAQTGFNESTQYLFLFDEKHAIKRVFKELYIYD